MLSGEVKLNSGWTLKKLLMLEESLLHRVRTMVVDPRTLQTSLSGLEEEEEVTEEVLSLKVLQEEAVVLWTRSCQHSSILRSISQIAESARCWRVRVTHASCMKDTSATGPLDVSDS